MQPTRITLIQNLKETLLVDSIVQRFLIGPYCRYLEKTAGKRAELARIHGVLRFHPAQATRNCQKVSDLAPMLLANTSPWCERDAGPR